MTFFLKFLIKKLLDNFNYECGELINFLIIFSPFQIMTIQVKTSTTLNNNKEELLYQLTGFQSE